MEILFRKKSKIEKLKERYTSLMRESFEIALKDLQKSKIIHRKADKLFEEIKKLTYQNPEQ